MVPGSWVRVLVGLLVGSIGIDGCFYINVVSYLAVIGALLRMRVPASESNGRRATVLQSLRDGFGYVRQEKVITTFLLVSSIFNIFGRSFVTLLPVFAKEILRVGASGLGLIAAGPGLGTIMGSFSLAALGRVEAETGHPGYHTAGFFGQSLCLRGEQRLSNRVYMPCHGGSLEHGV